MNPLLFLFNLIMRGARRRFESDLRDPLRAQTARLSDILSANAGTVFGREYDFSRIRTPDDFRRAVPIRSYEQFSPYIDRMCRGEANVLVAQPVTMFATTSGTSAAPKHCPVTRRYELEHHRSHLLWMNAYANAHPGLFGGQFLTIVSPAVSGYTEGGIPVGSHSGRQYLNQAIPVRRKHPVPYEAFLIDSYEARYHALLAFALSADISTVTSVNPSTLVLLAQILQSRAEPLLADLEAGRLDHAGEIDPTLRAKLQQRLNPCPHRAGELRERFRTDGMLLPKSVWPNIRAMATWQGGSAPFYLSQLDDLWGRQPRRCLGLRASEGTLSIPLEDNTSSGALAVSGHFLEFLEEQVEPTPEAPTLLAHELETGKRYRTILTTSGGLYRYDLADIVEVTGMRHATPEIAFLHKAGNVLSVTGEKVTEDQVVSVMRNIRRSAPPLAGFTVTQEIANPPRLVLALEFDGDVAEGVELSVLDAFEQELRDANEEYREKRASGRLAEPKAAVLAPGSYRRYRESLVDQGRPDGQVKPPHLVRPDGPGPCPGENHPFFNRVTVLRVSEPAPAGKEQST